MTPVDATSTSSGRQPICCAMNSIVARATCIPASPVHAFAHPLLHTIALARPPDFARFSRDRSTVAACVLFVVNTAAAGMVRSVVMTMTSSGQACVDGLMSAYTPAAVKPAGAMMPPSSVSSRLSVRAAILDMHVRRRLALRLVEGLELGRNVEVGHHRVLFATPEQRAIPAVCHDFLRQPCVRNDRKSHVRKVGGLVREHAQIVV